MALSGERLGAFFFCLRCLSQTISTTRALDVLTWYPSPTTVFMLPMLLQPAFCFYLRRRESDLTETARVQLKPATAQQYLHIKVVLRMSYWVSTVNQISLLANCDMFTKHDRSILSYRELTCSGEHNRAMHEKNTLNLKRASHRPENHTPSHKTQVPTHRVV